MSVPVHRGLPQQIAAQNRPLHYFGAVSNAYATMPGFEAGHCCVHAKLSLLRRARHVLGPHLRDRPGGVADLEAREAAHGDILTQLADLLRNHVTNGDGLFLDERLLQEADLLVELRHLAFDDLCDHGRGLAGFRRLGAVDLLLPRKVGLRDILTAHIARIGRGDVHRNIL